MSDRNLGRIYLERSFPRGGFERVIFSTESPEVSDLIERSLEALSLHYMCPKHLRYRRGEEFFGLYQENLESGNLDRHNTVTIVIYDSVTLIQLQDVIESAIDRLIDCDCLTSPTADASRCTVHSWIYDTQCELVPLVDQDILNELRELPPLLPCVIEKFGDAEY